MADFFCDISAIGNEYQAYADTPATWAMPQDGNGLAGPGHSAAVAIATINCASATSVAASTLSLFGVTITVNGGYSGATLATNLVTLINAATTAVTATYSNALLPLNKLIFARVNPGLTTQVQIMVRIAGADWNGMTIAIGGTWTAQPSVTAFSGGANGPLAYINNHVAVFGKAANAYGSWFGALGAVSVPTITDIIHYRTQRSGANLGFSLGVASNTTLYWANRNHLYDDGTIWSGDEGTLTAALSVTGAYTLSLAHNATYTTVNHNSRKHRNLDILWSTSATNGAIIADYATTSNSQGAFVRIGFIQDLGSAAGSFQISSHSGSLSNNHAEIVNCFSRSYGTINNRISRSYYGGHRIKLNGSEWEVVAATGPIGQILNITNYQGACLFEWIGGRIYDTNGVYSCLSPLAFPPNIATGTKFIVENVTGVTDISAGFSGSATVDNLVCWSSLIGANKAFRTETNAYMADWKGDGTFPHCGAQNLAGDYWSHRITWTAVPTTTISITPLKMSLFYRAASAVKTFTLELYTPDSTLIYKDELSLLITYIDSDGVCRDDRLSGCGLRGMMYSADRSAIDSSATTWTANGVAAYGAKKLTVTTSYPVMQNTEVTISLMLCAPKSPSITFYVSPEVTLS